MSRAKYLIKVVWMQDEDMGPMMFREERPNCIDLGSKGVLEKKRGVVAHGTAFFESEERKATSYRRAHTT